MAAPAHFSLRSQEREGLIDRGQELKAGVEASLFDEVVSDFVNVLVSPRPDNNIQSSPSGRLLLVSLHELRALALPVLRSDLDRIAGIETLQQQSLQLFVGALLLVLAEKLSQVFT